MMKLRLTLLSIFTLSVCSFAGAQEYKTPSVNFKKATLKQNRVADAEVDDYYKYETRTKGNDRQIASEDIVKEADDRKPSSLKNYKDYKEEEPAVAPGPHLNHPRKLIKNSSRHSRKTDSAKAN